MQADFCRVLMSQAAALALGVPQGAIVKSLVFTIDGAPVFPFLVSNFLPIITRVRR